MYGWLGDLWRVIIVEGCLRVDEGDKWTLAESSTLADKTTRGKNQVVWIKCKDFLHVRDCYKSMKTHMLDSARAHQEGINVILKSKTGRGKSVFMLWLIFELLLSAKRNRSSTDKSSSFQDYELNPRILYGIGGSLNERTFYLLTVDSVIPVEYGSNVWYQCVGRNTHFWFLDNIDMRDPYATVLCLSLMTDDELYLKQFTKRLSHTKGSFHMYFPSPSVPDLISLFPERDEEEVKFKNEVVGGYVRAHCSSGMFVSRSYPLYDVVKDILGWYFGEEYVPIHPDDDSRYGYTPRYARGTTASPTAATATASTVVTAKGEEEEEGEGDNEEVKKEEKRKKKMKYGKWALDVIINKISLSMNNRDSSLFIDYAVDENYRGGHEHFATPFLGILAGALLHAMKNTGARTWRERLDNSAARTLRDNLFGGIGFFSTNDMLEHDAHMYFIDGARPDTACWCVNSEDKYESIYIGGRKKVLIRSWGDIQNLHEGEYGLPTMADFPLGDAIIPPNTLLLMTRHKRINVSRDAGKLVDIAAALGVTVDAMKIVYIVSPNEVSSVFEFSSNPLLQRAEQWVTTLDYGSSVKGLKELVATNERDDYSIRRKKEKKKAAKQQQEQLEQQKQKQHQLFTLLKG